MDAVAVRHENYDTRRRDFVILAAFLSLGPFLMMMDLKHLCYHLDFVFFLMIYDDEVNWWADGEISTGLEVVLQIVFSCVRFLYSGDVGGGMGDKGKGKGG